MLNEKIKCSFEEIPFKTSLSFEYLIDEIREISQSKDHLMAGTARSLIKKLDKVPELCKIITDFEIVRKNRALVNQMMAFIFNPVNDDITMGTVMAPFYPRPLYSTKLFEKAIKGEEKKIDLAKDYGSDNILLTVIYQAYLIILQKFYDFEHDIDIPFTYRIYNEENDSVKYYKMIVNPRFTEVKSHAKLKKLTRKELKSLFDRSSDLDYWNSKIPLENFEFTGFLQFNYIDITSEFVISQLKSDLLDKTSILTDHGFNQIRRKVRTLMEDPHLEFGLAAASDFNSSINQNMIWKSIVPLETVQCDEYSGSIYETAYENKSIVLTDDLKKGKRDKITEALLKKGVRSHAIIPLVLDEEIVGMLEFGSARPDVLNMVQIKRFHELFPVFALALKRSREEWDDMIRAIIQEECTAIHPVVEWRFREAAWNMVESNLRGQPSGMENIVFNNIIPIFGATDIRGSSVERQKAIQSDLTDHLNLARKVLKKCLEVQEMPLLDQLTFKTEEFLKNVKTGLKAGDEVSILEFIKKEIDPVFVRLRDRDPNMTDEIDAYFNQMDPELGVLYRKRKDFEESLSRINDITAKILDQEQALAQQVFPHYFEKYRTDGIEYNAYIGQALVKGLQYDEIYLKNLRLWQLLVKIKIARKIREINPTLKTSLDVTQLILVHSNPLSIAFRQDEKKFDVAGAYNIRYEITKKRIDKALIKGTKERLTQVGKIAIIYSYAEEIEEYRKYINYLISRGYLKETVEEFVLEDMQGASGLHALRVEVNFDPVPEIDEINISEIQEVIRKN